MQHSCPLLGQSIFTPFDRTKSVLWIEIVEEVWKDLKGMYYKETFLEFLSYWNRFITAYFTQLKCPWLEIQNLEPLPTCSFEVRYACKVIPAIKLYGENEYVIIVFKVLNDQNAYASFGFYIMPIEPLPNIDKCFLC